MEANQSEPQPQKKTIKGVEFTEIDLAKCRMIADYLIIDRFDEKTCASFLRFEKCFGPLFPKNRKKDFSLLEAFKELVGPKKKYFSFKRLVNAFIKWKSGTSKNESFNYFMSQLFDHMIKGKEEVIGDKQERDRIFNTNNCKGRHAISKVTLLTDETKAPITGMVFQYDEFFNAELTPNFKKENINLELNLTLNENPLKRDDRDGISQLSGVYNKTIRRIKLLILKCRSGKTAIVGDSSEEKEGEEYESFLIGTSKCQLKSIRVAYYNKALCYLEPVFKVSVRNNNNLNIQFEDITEKFLDEEKLIYEEEKLSDRSEEEINQKGKFFFYPGVRDDEFIDKEKIIETIPGKNFEDFYESAFIDKDLKKILKQSIITFISDKKFREEVASLRAKNAANVVTNEDKDHIIKKDFEGFLAKVLKKRKAKREKKEKEKKEGEDKKDDNGEIKEAEEEEEFEDDDDESSEGKESSDMLKALGNILLGEAVENKK